MRQAVDVKISDRNASNAPVIIAPIMLVAANVMPKSTKETSAAPKIPVSSVDRIAQHLAQGFLAATRSVTARYTTAMPRTTHRKAGATVITAVI